MTDKTKSLSCAECVNEMSMFCKNCPHINTNITGGLKSKGFSDPEDWAHDQYQSVIKSADYRTLNKLQDNLIEAIRAFETEVERWK